MVHGKGLIRSVCAALLIVPAISCGSSDDTTKPEASGPSYSGGVGDLSTKGWLPYDTDVSGKFGSGVSYSFAAKWGANISVSSSHSAAAMKLYGPKETPTDTNNNGWGDPIATSTGGEALSAALSSDGEYAVVVEDGTEQANEEEYTLKLTCGNDLCVYQEVGWLAFVYGALDTHDGDDADMSPLKNLKESANSSDNRYLIFLEDLPGEGNSKLHQITSKNNSKVIRDYGEISTQSPANLVKVLRYVHTLYPAKQFFLNFLGHSSSGLRAFMPDYTPDDGVWAHQRLMYWQIRDALKTAGYHIDVLGLSGCGTSDLEIMYALRDTADYITAFQEEGQSEGYRYSGWIGALPYTANANPTADDLKSYAEALVSDIVSNGNGATANMDCYARGKELKALGLECPPPSSSGGFRTSELEAVKTAFTSFVTEMNKVTADCSADLVDVRTHVQEMYYKWGFDSFVDARDFASRVANTSCAQQNSGLKTAATNLRDGLVKLTVASAANPVDEYGSGGDTPEDHTNAHGLNVLFMRQGVGADNYFTSTSGFDSCSAYQSGDADRFYSATGWIGFVEEMFDKVPAPSR